VKQEIDGWHPELQALLEIESGRGVHRDLVRSSLVVEAEYLVLGVRSRYEYGSRNAVQNDFTFTRDLLDSIYASGRLHLPFIGVLLVGW
jgi:hypothetical protein